MSNSFYSYLLFMFVFSQVSSQTSQQPNIIFILTDDQRFDALGYAGNDLAHTPEMDKLAEEGTFFSKAMVSTPICAASRATILTGLYERTHSFNFQTSKIRSSYMEESYPTILKNSGYKTAFYGKYGVKYTELEKQFDDFESYDRNTKFKDRRGYYYKTIGQDTVHLTRYTGQKALDYIDETDDRSPFCLSLSFSAPHAHDSAEDQYFWQGTSDEILAGVTVPDADKGEDKYFNSQPKIVRDGFNRLRWTWRYNTPEKYQHSVKGYHRMIAGIDFEIAKIRKKLEEKGMTDNTVIILMGDNGYFLGERQFAGKWLLYDNSVRVPLIIFDPRVKNQKDSEVLAMNIDIPSTILELAGVSQPESWQGKSLVPIINKTSQNIARDTALIEHLWEFDHIPPSEGVRTKDWKYFRYVNDQSIEELYNLKDDSREIKNLAEEEIYAAKLSEFRIKTTELIGKFSDNYSKGPSDLIIEYTTDPAGLNNIDPSPKYSWVVPVGAVTQSAYQILVSSSLEYSNYNIGDIWDSGQVRDNLSSEIKHAGKALSLEKTYYWKVRVWDIDNRLSKYSEPKEFKIE